MTTNRFKVFFKLNLVSNNPKKIALIFYTPRSHANFNSRNLSLLEELTIIIMPHNMKQHLSLHKQKIMKNPKMSTDNNSKKNDPNEK
jgi:hypothetical protein